MHLSDLLWVLTIDTEVSIWTGDEGQDLVDSGNVLALRKRLSDKALDGEVWAVYTEEAYTSVKLGICVEMR